MTSWTVACQAPLSTGFSWHEYWSGLPFPPPGDLPDPGIELDQITKSGRSRNQWAKDVWSTFQLILSKVNWRIGSDAPTVYMNYIFKNSSLTYLVSMINGHQDSLPPEMVWFIMEKNFIYFQIIPNKSFT